VKIFYGICGEGMGHAGRSIALIERLAALGHQVTIFTFADALQLLTRSGYKPHRINGLRFSTTPNGGVSALGTLANFTSFSRCRNESLDFIQQLALAERPDLFVTDFEPLTALAAASLGIPCASVDNQHKFCAPLGDDFSRSLRLYGRLAGAFISRWIREPRPCVVAVFHGCPVTPHFRRVNTLLRDRMARLKPTAGNHVLIYGRRAIGEQLAKLAAAVRERFIVYGCDGPPADDVEYKPTTYDEFAADLASCKAVICTAGQQLIGEAIYFGKPILAVPIPCQHEQTINAHFVRLEGVGDFCTIDQLSAGRIARFLRQEFRVKPSINGLDETIELLDVRHESAVA
jgi:uncharacterized protein (TIGR00661 family)